MSKNKKHFCIKKKKKKNNDHRQSMDSSDKLDIF